MGRRHPVLVLLALSATPAAAQSPCGTEVELARLDAGVAGPELRTPGGAPVIGGPFSLRVEGALANTAGAMVFAFNESPFFSPEYGAIFWFGAPYGTLFFTTDADGRSPALFAAPAVDPFFCNEFGLFQGGVFDPAATGGVAVTNAIRIRVGEPRGPLFPNAAVSGLSAPFAVATDDLNGDGIADLAVANNGGGGSLGVALGRTDGGFDVSTEPLSGAYDVAIADVDGDGSPDLAGTSVTLDEAWVFLGAGDGTFTQDPAHRVAVGDQPQSVALPDLDGDGSADLVVANTFDGTLSLAAGNGDGSFATPVTVGVGGLPQDVAAADLDGDGNPDLAVAAKGFDRVDLLLGDGAGGIASSDFTAASGGPQALALADLDGDGALDLLAACIFADALRVRLGAGDGSFGTETVYATGPDPLAVDTADLDGDGAIDVVVGERRPSGVAVFPGVGDGTLGAPDAYPIEFDDIIGAVRDLVVLDAGDDGELDVATVGLVPDEARLLVGLGDGTFAVPTEIPAGALPDQQRWDSARTVDLDQDGNLDLVTFKRLRLGESGSLGVHLADGAGGLAAGLVSNVGTPDAELGDVDGDGLVDLVYANPNTELLEVSLGTGTGTFVPFLTQDPVAGPGPEPRRTALSDLDLDGQLDLTLRAEGSTYELIFLPGTGAGTFATSSAQTFPLSATDFPVVFWFQEGEQGELVPGDFEGDGYPDLALIDRFAGVFLRGTAAGLQLGTTFTAPTFSRTRPIAADLDEDGGDELLFGTVSPTSSVVVLTGGSAATSVQYPVADSLGVSSPYTPDLEVADFDGDGTLDVLYGTEALGLLRGVGDGTLGPPSRHWLEWGSTAVAALDLDGNGVLDLVSLRVGDDEDQAVEIRTNLTGK